MGLTTAFEISERIRRNETEDEVLRRHPNVPAEIVHAALGLARLRRKGARL